MVTKHHWSELNKTHAHAHAHAVNMGIIYIYTKYKHIYSNSAEHNFTRTVKIPLTRSIFHVMCEAAIDTSLQSIMLKCRWMKAQRSIFHYSLMFFFLFFVVYHLGDFLLCSFFAILFPSKRYMKNEKWVYFRKKMYLIPVGCPEIMWRNDLNYVKRKKSSYNVYAKWNECV